MMSGIPVEDENSVLGSSAKRTPLSLVGVLSIIILWTLLSSFKLVNPLLLPSPMRVIVAAKDIGFDLAWHVLATVIRALAGLFLGGVVGFSVGVLMQYSRRAFILLDGVVETSRPVPPVALVPFFILLFGFSEYGKILLVALGTGLVITVATVEAIERVPSGVVRWGLVSGLSRAGLFRYIILPAALPDMRTGARIALATAITLVIVSEFMGSTYGLGYLINVSKITLTTPTIVLCIIILGWLSWGLDRALRLAFDRVSAWDIRAKGAVR
jgi:sulfonate transport system permease protein